MELALNAHTEEYVHHITPLVGFKVTVGDGTDSSSVVEISPGFHSTIFIDKVCALNHRKQVKTDYL